MKTLAALLVFFSQFWGSAAFAQSDQKFNPADYLSPTECPRHFENDKGVCMPKAAEIAKLDDAQCNSAPLKFTKDKGCEAPTENPTALCKTLSGYKSELDSGKCSYSRIVPTSGRGDYIGDCFKVTAIPPGTRLRKGQHFVVTDQRKTADDTDTTLVVAEAKGRNFLFIPDTTFTCGIEEGRVTRELSANALTAAGAKRFGWAFGVLTVPFKYYSGESAFTSSVQLGPYLGYRWGEAGSAWTAAVGFTLGSVKANTVAADVAYDKDGKPAAVTGTADVAAVSSSIGLMVDLWKSPGAKPFKVGLFYGSDRVNKEPTTYYRFNKRPWFALQFGFDFTDN